MAASACGWLLYIATTEFIADIAFLLRACRPASDYPAGIIESYLLLFQDFIRLFVGWRGRVVPVSNDARGLQAIRSWIDAIGVI
jgi:hypothetical protein